jgi:hypothetical protein
VIGFEGKVFLNKGVDFSALNFENFELTAFYLCSSVQIRIIMVGSASTDHLVNDVYLSFSRSAHY